jgi:hypothetical protein
VGSDNGRSASRTKEGTFCRETPRSFSGGPGRHVHRDTQWDEKLIDGLHQVPWLTAPAACTPSSTSSPTWQPRSDQAPRGEDTSCWILGTVHVRQALAVDCPRHLDVEPRRKEGLLPRLCSRQPGHPANLILDKVRGPQCSLPLVPSPPSRFHYTYLHDSRSYEEEARGSIFHHSAPTFPRSPPALPAFHRTVTSPGRLLA